MTKPIDRRTFLGGAVSVGALGALHSAGRLAPRPAPTATTIGGGAAPVGNRTLVLVTLYGGNDGLSTIVPYQDPAYYQQRGSIAIPATAVLPLGNGVGLHPSLTGINALWGAGNVAVLRGVGYPDPNYSHFASMDIWQSADVTNDSTTGWIGRWIEGTNANALDALWLGSNVPLAFVGKNTQASSIVANSSATTQLPPGDAMFRAVYELLDRHQIGRNAVEMAIADQATSMLTVSNAVSQAFLRIPVPKTITSAAGSLGTQLAAVSQLITAGLPTRVYGVSMNGFDSHAGETSSYTTLYSQLDAAVSGFFKSIAGTPAAANTVMMIYSEFGRRVVANASGGTDHGAASDAFVIGQPIKGGLYGSQPSLTQLDSNGSLVANQDFRSVYATILDQVIDVDPVAVLKGSFPQIGFI